MTVRGTTTIVVDDEFLITEMTDVFDSRQFNDMLSA